MSNFLIPDYTLTTAVFRPSTTDHCHVTKTLDSTIRNTKALMAIPVYLVIYGDQETIPLLQEIREKYGHYHLTQYNIVEKKDLWSFQYLDQVKKNREIYHPSSNERHTEETHLLQCNKADFVLQTIENDPFKTSHFGWVDAFLGEETIRISTNYTLDVLPNILNGINDDKFHIQVLNVADKLYKLAENKRDFYSRYQYVVCGGFYTCGKTIGTQVLSRLKEIFVETTDLGFGHGEEMLYLEILDEFDQDIVRSYGDYGQMWDNFLEPMENVHYVYWMILRRYMDFGYFKEAYYCARAVIRSIVKYGNGKITPDVLKRFYIPLHVFQDFVNEFRTACFNYKPVEGYDNTLEYTIKM